MYLAWRQLLEILTDLHYTPQYSLLPFGIPFQVILFPFLWSWFIPLVVLQFQSVTSSYFSLTHAGLSRIKRHQGRPGERGRQEHQGRPGHHRRSGHRKKSEQETFNSSKCQKLQYVCLCYSLSIYIPRVVDKMFQISLLKFSDFALFSFAICVMLTIPAHLTVLRKSTCWLISLTMKSTSVFILL